MRKQLAYIAIIMASLYGNVQAADVAAGQEKSNACAMCHGPDGNAVNALWPNLAGQHPSYIKKQLHDFKAERRNDPVMSAMALPLTDIEIENLAAYFATQTVKPGAAKPELVSLGERIYRGGNPETGVPACMACHGPSGLGNPSAGNPAVANQNMDYVVKQLNDFKAGSRANDTSLAMRQLAARMTKEEIEAVASYINGLH